MINADTPLPEVIRFIPREVAEVLIYQPIEIQTWVARALRGIMSDWEQTDVHLDPIMLENVLRPVIIQLMADGSQIAEMAGREG